MGSSGNGNGNGNGSHESKSGSLSVAADNLKREKVCRLYGKALFDLANEKGGAEKLWEDLLAMQQLFSQNPSLEEALGAFTFSVNDRVKVAEEVLKTAGADSLVIRLVALLTEKNRLKIFPGIVGAYRDLLDEKTGLVRGSITTAEPLSDSERNDLSKTFEKKLGKKIVLDASTDKSLLGGLVVRIQGKIFDGSLRTSLDRLRDTLERQSL